MNNNYKEQLLDLQVLINLLQTPNLSQENLDTVNKLINTELLKVFKDKLAN